MAPAPDRPRARASDLNDHPATALPPSDPGEPSDTGSWDRAEPGVPVARQPLDRPRQEAPDRRARWAPVDAQAAQALHLAAGAVEAVLNAPPAWADFAAARDTGTPLGALSRGDALVLGMGGSALGTRAAWAVMRADAPHELRVLDSLDAEIVGDALEWARQREASLIVVSKSGHTTEIDRLTSWAIHPDHGLAHLRGASPGLIAVVSDPDRTPLDAALSAARLTATRFSMPASVGGRYSIFTAVGQVPLAVVGLNATALVDAAQTWWSRLTDDAALRAVLAVAPLSFRLRAPRPVHALWTYDERLVPLAAWLAQLECESLGRRRDDAPASGELVCTLRGPADQHSIAQLLLHGPPSIRVQVWRDAPCADARTHSRRIDADVGDDPRHAVEALRRASHDATVEALYAEGVPVMACAIAPNAEGVAAMMLLSMLEVVALAALEGVDPYGQPAVERIKRGVAARFRATSAGR